MMQHTPIIDLGSLGSKVNLYIKREDLLPFSFGGNKVRIAGEFYADMLRKGSNCMIGYGNSRSNLCRVLSNICCANNTACHIVSPRDEDGSRVETMNSRLVNSSGTVLHICSKKNVSKTVEEVIQQCTDEGMSPYYMYGNIFGSGNKDVPVRAYAKVYDEISTQSREMGVKFDYIFLATGTGMTQAGLEAGRALRNGEEKIIGISVARKAEQEIPILESYIDAYWTSIDQRSTKKNLILTDKYLCGGYGKYNAQIERTIVEAYYRYGFPLDTTYTGKAFWGMKSMIEEQKLEGNVLFIHTGGTPLFFDQIALFEGKK